MSIFSKIRFWLLRKLAGNMTVILNAKIGGNGALITIGKGEAFISNSVLKVVNVPPTAVIHFE